MLKSEFQENSNPIFNKISTSFTKPIAKYHGKIIYTFTQKLPSKGTLADLVKRIIAVVIAPLAYLALGALALFGIAFASIISLVKKNPNHPAKEKPENKELEKTTESKKIESKKIEETVLYREITYDPPETYPITAYETVQEKVKLLWTQQEINQTTEHGSQEDIEKMQKEISSPPLVLLQDDVSKTGEKIQLTRKLGNGGCKKAVQISNEKALLLPNMDADPMGNIQKRWPRIVKEECQMSQFLQEIGLPCSPLQEVLVFPTQDSQDCIPAYVTDSFEQLKKKNIYIIDTKNKGSSTWGEDKKLFKSIDDAKIAKNWEPFIDLLIKDIVKLVYYNLPLGGDSFNIAIFNEQNNIKIRYFGFDFTSKNTKTLIPVLNKNKNSASNQIQEEFLPKIKKAFGNAIEEVLFKEYQADIALPQEAYVISRDLKNEFSAKILQEIEALQHTETMP